MWRGYFLPALIGYFVGLNVTIVALSLMRLAQPALLYLVPGTLGTTVALAACRGELGLLWEGVVSCQTRVAQPEVSWFLDAQAQQQQQQQPVGISQLLCCGASGPSGPAALQMVQPLPLALGHGPTPHSWPAQPLHPGYGPGSPPPTWAVDRNGVPVGF